MKSLFLLSSSLLMRIAVVIIVCTMTRTSNSADSIVTDLHADIGQKQNGKILETRSLTSNDQDAAFMVLIKKNFPDGSQVLADPGCLISPRLILTFYDKLNPASSANRFVNGVNATAGQLESSSAGDLQDRSVNMSEILPLDGYTPRGVEVNSIVKQQLASLKVRDPFIIGDAVKTIPVMSVDTASPSSLAGVDVPGLYYQFYTVAGVGGGRSVAGKVRNYVSGVECPSTVEFYTGTLDSNASSCLLASPDGIQCWRSNDASALVVRGKNGINYLAAISNFYKCNTSSLLATIIGSALTYANHKSKICGQPDVVCDDPFVTTTIATTTTSGPTTTKMQQSQDGQHLEPERNNFFTILSMLRRQIAGNNC